MKPRAGCLRITSSNLPELPAVRRKREQKVTPAVLHWFKHNYPSTVALEIKATSNMSVTEARLQPHQRAALIDTVSMSGLAHKIADTGRRLPFDGFVIKGAAAFVVACFTRYGVCYAVPVQQWRGFRVTSAGTPRDASPYTLRIPIYSS